MTTNEPKLRIEWRADPAEQAAAKARGLVPLAATHPWLITACRGRPELPAPAGEQTTLLTHEQATALAAAGVDEVYV